MRRAYGRGPRRLAEAGCERSVPDIVPHDAMDVMVHQAERLDCGAKRVSAHGRPWCGHGLLSRA
jgi:hypothetical protein